MRIVVHNHLGARKAVGSATRDRVFKSAVPPVRHPVGRGKPTTLAIRELAKTCDCGGDCNCTNCSGDCSECSGCGADRDRMPLNFRDSLSPKGDIAYKGYLIRINPFRDTMWIERDGHFISYAKDLKDARQKIDEIVD